MITQNDPIESLIQKFVSSLREAVTKEVTKEITASINARVANALSNQEGLVVKVDKRIGNNQKRTRDVIDETKQRVLVALKEEPGLRSEQLQRVLHLKATHLALPLAELLKEKKIKSEGVARGRKYTLR